MGKIVIIGAGIAGLALSQLLKLEEKNILLVEPVPYNYKILKKNFEKKDNIFICTNAIFSETVPSVK